MYVQQIGRKKGIHEGSELWAYPGYVIEKTMRSRKRNVVICVCGLEILSFLGDNQICMIS